jgi:hypothetical protein
MPALHQRLRADEGRAASEPPTAEEFFAHRRGRRSLFELSVIIAAAVTATIIAADELGLIHVDGDVALALVGLLTFEAVGLVLLWLFREAVDD